MTPVVQDPLYVAAVQQAALEDQSLHAAFDRLTRLAATVLHAPVSLVTLTDAVRQVFVSSVGLPEPWVTPKETSLFFSFCRHTIAAQTPLVINDTRLHSLVQDNPSVAALGVVAYAGIPLLTKAGDAVGSLCVIDHTPRVWTPQEVAILSDLAASVMTEIELRVSDAARLRLLNDVARVRAATEVEHDRLSEIFTQAPTLIALLVGAQHRFEFANSRYQRSVGRTQDALIGQSLATVLPAFAEQGVVALLDEVYRTGVPYHAVESLVRGNRRGEEVRDDAYVTFIYQPLYDARGTVQGILINGVDVTDQVQARRRVQELAAVAERARLALQQVVNVLPEGIIITDKEGRIVQANNMAGDLLGSDVVGRLMVRVERDAATRETLQQLDGTPYPPGRLPLERSLQEGAEVRGVQLLLCGQAAVIPVLLNSIPLYDNAGVMSGAVVVFQDITTIKNFEKARDALLATVAHDLKNPLTAIQGLAELTQTQAQRGSTPSSERIATRQAGILTAAAQMTALLNELLDAMQLQMGQPLKLERRPTDLVALVHRVIDHQQEIADHPLRVEAATPTLVCLVDAERIERVVGNLVANAVKYSPLGAEVSVALHADGEGDDARAVVVVRDHGRGIPAADVPHIFDRFYRGDNVGQMQGSGIGLASVREVVVQHSGTVHVESTETVGTTMTVTLPRHDDAESDTRFPV